MRCPFNVYTPREGNTHWRESKNPMGASLQLDTKSTFLQNILAERKRKGEVYEKQNQQRISSPRWNKARMNVLNKKLFVKTMYLPLFALCTRIYPPKKTRTKKDANMNVQFDTCRTAHF